MLDGEIRRRLAARGPAVEEERTNEVLSSYDQAHDGPTQRPIVESVRAAATQSPVPDAARVFALTRTGANARAVHSSLHAAGNCLQYWRKILSLAATEHLAGRKHLTQRISAPARPR
ncbi:MAG TPA: hypothetical protein VE056_07225 [Pyrinomonadaceae bacterium]|nr:hypothetical protein [Pyrinomonadaceae bacterium]